jgi:hypothetical protein
MGSDSAPRLDGLVVWNRHSYRNARIGSTLDARRAGIQAASAPAAASTRIAIAVLDTSNGNARETLAPALGSRSRHEESGIVADRWAA